MQNKQNNDEYENMPCGAELRSLDDETQSVSSTLSNAFNKESETRDEINELISKFRSLADSFRCQPEAIVPLPDIDVAFNTETDQSIAETTGKTRAFPPLTTTEYIVTALAGSLSVIIDVLFVGTPEVAKIYRGDEEFGGSKLTEIIRKIKPDEGKSGTILKWLSDKCKVPYDISCESGVMTPNNHRLRSLGHDPYLGLFFAIADIIMGTTTCIDNNGALKIIPNYKTCITEKILSVFYYIGHIVSDLFTSRGLPIPGFFLTQFFTGGGKDGSLAEIAENMYMDGYDTRHLVSMAVPVAVKTLILEAYCRITKPKISGLLPLAEKERAEQTYRLKKEKMLFIANAIGTGGNVVKFVAPPSCCNPCALNAAQWFAFIRSSIQMTRAVYRDKSAEIVLDGRTIIDQNWDSLLQSDN